MAGNEAPRRPKADLAPRRASEHDERNKLPLDAIAETAEIAEIIDDIASRGTLSQYACSCHGCRTCHGCREAGPS